MFFFFFCFKKIKEEKEFINISVENKGDREENRKNIVLNKRISWVFLPDCKRKVYVFALCFFFFFSIMFVTRYSLPWWTDRHEILTTCAENIAECQAKNRFLISIAVRNLETKMSEKTWVKFRQGYFLER